MEDLEKLAKCKRGDMVYVPRYNYGAIERHCIDSITVKRADTKKRRFNQSISVQHSMERNILFRIKTWVFRYHALVQETFT